MKKIPFLLTLILTVAWGYTAWYWYTCNIQGFCDGNTSLIRSETPITPDLFETVEDTTSASGGDSNLQKLSAGDVLVENTSQTPQVETTVLTASGQTQSSTGSENLIKESQDETLDLSSSSSDTICTASFVGPIALGGKNTKDQVEILEKFLISQGGNIKVDGEYSSQDAEVVKEFQLAHKEDILDPWGIEAPTGYVYTTTIKKMKEIGCQ